jgi:hypothetical protein
VNSTDLVKVVFSTPISGRLVAAARNPSLLLSLHIAFPFFIVPGENAAHRARTKSFPIKAITRRSPHRPLTIERRKKAKRSIEHTEEYMSASAYMQITDRIRKICVGVANRCASGWNDVVVLLRPATIGANTARGGPSRTHYGRRPELSQRRCATTCCLSRSRNVRLRFSSS